jgi:phenylacetate-CoA ligase
MKAEPLRQVAEEKLRRIVTHAYRTSAYYRQAWDSTDFRPSSGFSSRDLQHLPFLTKDALKAHKESLVSDRYRADQLDVSYTGGTTGTQTSFYLDRFCKVSRFGRQLGMLELCGYRPGMRRALVWGVQADLPPGGMRRSLKQWFRNYASSEEALCCHVLNEPVLREYHHRLTRFRPDVLYGYPSALVQLAQFAEEESLAPIRVSRIITTAEHLSGSARTRLARVFGGEVFNLYCTREHGCIGFECERHQGFHVDTGSVYLEIVSNGRPVEPGQNGEIVITDLLNYGMPFIRSQIKDLGAWSAQPCECGSPLPLLKGLDGRSSDLLYRPDGSTVPGLLATDVFHELSSIRYLQFVQERIDRIELRLVVTHAFSEEVRREVLRQVRKIMGDAIAVEVRIVDEIERNPRSGKLREVVCTVDPQELARARAALPQE